MKDQAPGVDMPNNMKPKNYPQDFVYSKDFPQHPSKGEHAPAAEIMKQVMPK